ncbi:MAG TPA: HD domain-containing protein [Desulfosalsimonadaceae bacterium]|nr:HD domain-containing protein [Desulfosalsimonadaceae bacterium]
MSSQVPSREQAWELLTRYNQNQGLINHALAVEAVMRRFAEKFGEDPDKWGIIGLVHDLDYEQYPDIHCQKTREILNSERWPEEYIRAVLSHGYGIVTDVEPQSMLEKTLYTIDELTGLVAAAVLVRPSKSILDLKPKSVTKKWKDRRFAAGVNRQIIEDGCMRLNMELSEVIAETIAGMQSVAERIGLKGNPPEN